MGSLFLEVDSATVYVYDEDSTDWIMLCSFMIESDVDEQIEIVCGFYCGDTSGSAGRVLSNLRLVETGA